MTTENSNTPATSCLQSAANEQQPLASFSLSELQHAISYFNLGKSQTDFRPIDIERLQNSIDSLIKQLHSQKDALGLSEQALAVAEIELSIIKLNLQKMTRSQWVGNLLTNIENLWDTMGHSEAASILLAQAFFCMLTDDQSTPIPLCANISALPDCKQCFYSEQLLGK